MIILLSYNFYQVILFRKFSHVLSAIIRFFNIISITGLSMKIVPRDTLSLLLNTILIVNYDPSPSQNSPTE